MTATGLAAGVDEAAAGFFVVAVVAALAGLTFGAGWDVVSICADAESEQARIPKVTRKKNFIWIAPT
jgi:hypothetical protein